jgi:hypothetical protein
MKEQFEDRDDIDWRARLNGYRQPPTMPAAQIWSAIRRNRAHAASTTKRRVVALALAASLAIFALGSAIGYAVGARHSQQDDLARNTGSPDLAQGDMAITWF